MSGRRLDAARAGATLLLLLGTGVARARGSASAEPATEVWVNLTPGKALGGRSYVELDVEPKLQVSGDDRWRNLDLTPLAELYPTGWLDLEAEATIGKTHQRDGLDTVELTPRVGFRLHLFQGASRGPKHQRLPLTRLDLSALVRLEWRNFHYSDETPSRHEWRARARLEGKLAVNHSELSEDRTLYALGDVEYFAPLGDDIPERYVNKTRVRLGLGYRASGATRMEALYIRDWNRQTPGEEQAQDKQAFDLRIKLQF